MNEIIYDGYVVNSVVPQISDLQDKFTSLSSDIKTATSKIVSAKGYNEYIGGINSDSFSSYVEQCGAVIGELVHIIRQKQIDILAYSGDEKEINLFLDTLSNKDYQTLDLARLDQYISFGRRIGNFFTGLWANTATIGAGLLEGGLEFIETGAD